MISMYSRLYAGLASILFLLTALTATSAEQTPSKDGKWRIAVVSSYHREYLWSQDTNSGLLAGFIETKMLDSKAQAEQYTEKDCVESSRAIIRKFWMDTKRRSSTKDISASLIRIRTELDAFKPNLIMLGDDNATNYLGNVYLDTGIPVVFWGVNGLPVKYGLIDSIEKPGHNVTGIY